LLRSFQPSQTELALTPNSLLTPLPEAPWLLLEHREQALTYDPAQPLPKNPAEILDPGLRRCLHPCLLIHGVG
jgi:hypothetical protein